MFARTYSGLHSFAQGKSIQILAMMHFAGIIGLLSPISEYFSLLTPFNLLVSAYILWINHESQSTRMMYFVAAVYSLGFLVETLGANFGLVFGDYEYGMALGPKILGVPLLIGLNWVIIIYTTGALVDLTGFPVWARIIIGAAIAVGVDTLIEPVAMRYDFWQWAGNKVPMQNYTGWFFTSLLMFGLYYLLRVRPNIRVAIGYFIIQLLFFLILTVANVRF